MSLKNPPFVKFVSGIDVASLLDQVLHHPELWNKNPCRLSMKGPHHETQDMFLRYRDETSFLTSGDWSHFADEHVSQWNRTVDHLPAAKPLIYDLMSDVKGENLGGVFLYKVEPGRKIYRHVDRGWHAEFYEKFNICLDSNDESVFWYPEHDVGMTQEPGDIHWFKNDVPHEVWNRGDTDHIILTVCISVDRGARGPWSPEGWTFDTRKEFLCQSVG